MVLNPNPPSSTTHWYERRENRPWIFGGLAVLVLVLSLLVVLWSRRNRDTETAAQHLADAKAKINLLTAVNDTVKFPRTAFSDTLTGAIADLQAALNKKNELTDSVVFGTVHVRDSLRAIKADVFAGKGSISDAQYRLIFPTFAMVNLVKWANSPSTAPRVGATPAVPPPIPIAGGDTSVAGTRATGAPAQAPAGNAGVAPTTTTPSPNAAAARPSAQKSSGKVAAAGTPGQKPSVKKPGARRGGRVAVAEKPRKGFEHHPGIGLYMPGYPANVNVLTHLKEQMLTWSIEVLPGPNNNRFVYKTNWQNEGLIEPDVADAMQIAGVTMRPDGDGKFYVTLAELVAHGIRGLNQGTLCAVHWAKYNWRPCEWGGGTDRVIGQLWYNQENKLYPLVGVAVEPLSVDHTDYLEPVQQKIVEWRKLKYEYNIGFFYMCVSFVSDGDDYVGKRNSSNPNCGICIMPVAREKVHYKVPVPNPVFFKSYLIFKLSDIGPDRTRCFDDPPPESSELADW